MGIFRKKKAQPENKPAYANYTEWEKDFGFLYLIMNRKQKITINFQINPRNKQLQSNDYLKDDDIDPLVEKGVVDTLNELGENYKQFLIDKYFGNMENLTVFITEDFYVELAGATISSNERKIRNGFQQRAVKAIGDMNSRDTSNLTKTNK